MPILSIDIGTKNCAFYIEEFDEESLTNEKVLTSGERKYWKLVDFSKGEIFNNIVMFLDQNRKEWDYCNGIIIERQMKLNYNAQVIQHFIYSYFKILYGPFKYISDISATRKTQVLGAPKKMSKPERKKWAISQAHLIFDKRDDIAGLQLLHAGKSDDLADACLQLKAFQKLVFVQGKLP